MERDAEAACGRRKNRAERRQHLRSGREGALTMSGGTFGSTTRQDPKAAMSPWGLALVAHASLLLLLLVCFSPVPSDGAFVVAENGAPTELPRKMMGRITGDEYVIDSCYPTCRNDYNPTLWHVRFHYSRPTASNGTRFFYSVHTEPCLSRFGDPDFPYCGCGQQLGAFTLFFKEPVVAQLKATPGSIHTPEPFPIDVEYGCTDSEGTAYTGVRIRDPGRQSVFSFDLPEAGLTQADICQEVNEEGECRYEVISETGNCCGHGWSLDPFESYRRAYQRTTPPTLPPPTTTTTAQPTAPPATEGSTTAVPLNPTSVPETITTLPPQSTAVPASQPTGSPPSPPGDHPPTLVPEAPTPTPYPAETTEAPLLPTTTPNPPPPGDSPPTTTPEAATPTPYLVETTAAASYPTTTAIPPGNQPPTMTPEAAAHTPLSTETTTDPFSPTTASPPLPGDLPSPPIPEAPTPTPYIAGTTAAPSPPATTAVPPGNQPPTMTPNAHTPTPNTADTTAAPSPSTTTTTPPPPGDTLSTRTPEVHTPTPYSAETTAAPASPTTTTAIPPPPGDQPHVITPEVPTPMPYPAETTAASSSPVITTAARTPQAGQDGDSEAAESPPPPFEDGSEETPTLPPVWTSTPTGANPIHGVTTTTPQGSEGIPGVISPPAVATTTSPSPVESGAATTTPAWPYYSDDYEEGELDDGTPPVPGEGDIGGGSTPSPTPNAPHMTPVSSPTPTAPQLEVTPEGTPSGTPTRGFDDLGDDEDFWLDDGENTSAPEQDAGNVIPTQGFNQPTTAVEGTPTPNLDYEEEELLDEDLLTDEDVETPMPSAAPAPPHVTGEGSLLESPHDLDDDELFDEDTPAPVPEENNSTPIPPTTRPPTVPNGTPTQDLDDYEEDEDWPADTPAPNVDENNDGDNMGSDSTQAPAHGTPSVTTHSATPEGTPMEMAKDEEDLFDDLFGEDEMGTPNPEEPLLPFTPTTPISQPTSSQALTPEGTPVTDNGEDDLFNESEDVQEYDDLDTPVVTSEDFQTQLPPNATPQGTPIGTPFDVEDFEDDELLDDVDDIDTPAPEPQSNGTRPTPSTTTSLGRPTPSADVTPDDNPDLEDYDSDELFDESDNVSSSEDSMDLDLEGPIQQGDDTPEETPEQGGYEYEDELFGDSDAETPLSDGTDDSDASFSTPSFLPATPSDEPPVAPEGTPEGEPEDFEDDLSDFEEGSDALGPEDTNAPVVTPLITQAAAPPTPPAMTTRTPNMGTGTPVSTLGIEEEYGDDELFDEDDLLGSESYEDFNTPVSDPGLPTAGATPSPYTTNTSVSPAATTAAVTQEEDTPSGLTPAPSLSTNTPGTLDTSTTTMRPATPVPSTTSQISPQTTTIPPTPVPSATQDTIPTAAPQMPNSNATSPPAATTTASATSPAPAATPTQAPSTTQGTTPTGSPQDSSVSTPTRAATTATAAPATPTQMALTTQGTLTTAVPQVPSISTPDVAATTTFPFRPPRTCELFAADLVYSSDGGAITDKSSVTVVVSFEDGSDDVGICDDCVRVEGPARGAVKGVRSVTGNVFQVLVGWEELHTGSVCISLDCSQTSMCFTVYTDLILRAASYQITPSRVYSK